ncbi:MAG: sel1 repeat family protein [Lachnospiraceae bacterium]|nr:sel1 repeat family protein [Lachnospiraceae bacterium]
MEYEELIKYVDGYENLTDEEEKELIRVAKYITKEDKSGNYSVSLGNYHYENKEFDKALDYYEKAADIGNRDAIENIGYIWYYGRTGEVNIEKAYKYFKKAEDMGSLRASYKIADMYKNGYYFEKDYDKYVEIIKELYKKIRNETDLFKPLPEIFSRYAAIKKDEGDIDTAIRVYFIAKDYLAQKIVYDSFFGNYTVMKQIVKEIYELIDFDEEMFDLYDLFYLLETPNKVDFFYHSNLYMIESVMEGDKCIIKFNGETYNSTNDFFKNASIDGFKITEIYDELTDFDLIKEDDED